MMQDVEQFAAKLTAKLDAFELRQQEKRAHKRAMDKRYPTMLRRVMALLLDLMVIMFLLAPVLQVVVALLLPSLNTPENLAFMQRAQAAFATHNADVPTIAQEALSRGIVQRIVLEQVVELGLLGLIVAGCLAKFGATPGMWVMRLRVVRADRITPITYWRALGFFASATFSIGLMVGYFTMWFTRERRAAHDFASGTAVVTLGELRRDRATAAMDAPAALTSPASGE